VELEPRAVYIERLALLEAPALDTTVLEARCGKGTYVRALARDMGRALGCLGHLVGLRRTLVAPFEEAQAVGLQTLEAAAADGGEEALLRLLLPVEAALQDLAELSVGQNDAARLLRGQTVLIRGRDAPAGGGPTYATCKGHLIAVGRIEKGELHPIRVFNFGNSG
jgi:tRNA pseudouridine55 synthase